MKIAMFVLLMLLAPSMSIGQTIPAAGLVVDSLGAIIGPVATIGAAGCCASIPSASVSVGGSFYVFVVYRGEITGHTGGSDQIVFESFDCSGPAFMVRNTSGNVMILRSVVWQIQAYLEDPVGVTRIVSIHSRAQDRGTECFGVGGDLLDVVPTLAPIDFSGFVPPFSVRPIQLRR